VLDQVPWTFRHPNAAAALVLVAFIVVFSGIWVAIIQRRLKRRAKAELQLVDEPVPENKQPNDGALVVLRGRLVGTRQDKPLPIGTPVLETQGPRRVLFDYGLSLEWGKERVALVGPHQVLLGAREGLPPGSGKRVLRAGDEVFVRGRWSVQKVETTTYRDVVVKGAIVPGFEDLEFVFVGTPVALGLAEAALAKGLAWGAFFWALAMSFGAWGALELAYKFDADGHILPVASFAYPSPFLRSNTVTFVRDHAGLLHPRDLETASQWAAIESFFDPDHECLNTLDNLRQTGRFEQEARLGALCGGTSSKRRAADALVNLGDIELAAQLLLDAPPLTKPNPRIPDVALDVLAFVVTKNWAQAAKLIGVHGHPDLAPPEEQCLILGLEARGGSFVSRDKLKSKAKTDLTCAVLEADLLEKEQRLAFITQIPEEVRDDGTKYLSEKRIIHRLRAESDPRHSSFSYISDEPRLMFTLVLNSRHFDSTPAIDLSVLEKFAAINDPQTDIVGERAELEASLAQFFAMIGDDSEATRLAELALRHMPRSDWSYCKAAVLQAAIAVRCDDPKALEYIERAEKSENPCHGNQFPYSRWVRDMRQGTRPENSQIFNHELGSRESFEALVKGSGKDLLAHCPPEELVARVILAGRRIKTDREILMDAIRYYDPECLVKRCPLEYLAHQAGMRALALRELRPAEIGREAELQALEERARKLRAPLFKRETAVILYLIERN
jgi:hypothetical protein